MSLQNLSLNTFVSGSTGEIKRTVSVKQVKKDGSTIYASTDIPEQLFDFLKKYGINDFSNCKKKEDK